MGSFLVVVGVIVAVVGYFPSALIVMTPGAEVAAFGRVVVFGGAGAAAPDQIVASVWSLHGSMGLLIAAIGVAIRRLADR